MAAKTSAAINMKNTLFHPWLETKNILYISVCRIARPVERVHRVPSIALSKRGLIDSHVNRTIVTNAVYILPVPPYRKFTVSHSWDTLPEI